MRRKKPKVRKVSWQFGIGPKKVLQTLGKPASRLQSLDRELKVHRTFREL